MKHMKRLKKIKKILKHKKMNQITANKILLHIMKKKNTKYICDYYYLLWFTLYMNNIFK